MLVATIALGVASGILLAGGILYACQRWGQQAVGLASRTGQGAWKRRRHIALGALLIAIIAGASALAIEDHARQKRVEANKRYYQGR